MKIIQTKTITSTFDVNLNDELLVYDYEEGIYMKAKITGVMEGQKLKIKCEDGIEYWETLTELANTRSYKFNNKNKI